MPKKILLIMIGALTAFLLLVFAILLGTKTLGFQITLIAEICAANFMASIIFIVSRKSPHNQTIRDLIMGFAYSNIAYLFLFFIAKSFVFSLLGGITS